MSIYEYQPSDDPKEQLAALVMQIKFDNNKVDCSGQAKTKQVMSHNILYNGKRPYNQFLFNG